MILHCLDVLTLGVIISKLKCYERMSSLIGVDLYGCSFWVNKGSPQWIQNQSSIQVHHWSSWLDHKGFKNPSSSPIVLPPKDLCFLPIDGAVSLSSMAIQFLRSGVWKTRNARNRKCNYAVNVIKCKTKAGFRRKLQQQHDRLDHHLDISSQSIQHNF